MIYLDNAATTRPKPPGVAEAVTAAMLSYGNSGRGTHPEALAAARTVYGLREKLAKWLDSMTDETQIDVVMEMTKPAVLDDAATADAARRSVDDDRQESGLLD